MTGILDQLEAVGKAALPVVCDAFPDDDQDCDGTCTIKAEELLALVRVAKAAQEQCNEQDANYCTIAALHEALKELEALK